MNEADKERYFREKEAYERITGQVLPVSKVVREHLQFSLLLFSLSGSCLIFQLFKCYARRFRGDQVTVLESFVLITVHCSVVSVDIQKISTFEGASEWGAVGPASEIQSGRTSIAGCLAVHLT